jgi:exopolyphosphatase/pppGpp-phosphohydrolase
MTNEPGRASEPDSVTLGEVQAKAAGNPGARPGAVIAASADVGANSVHLLVAAVDGHRIEPILDESVFLGLGDRVARDGYLGAEAREELVAALVSYVETARGLGAREITFLGTEPIRRAADAASVVSEVEARAGVPLHVLDHHEEGLLTLLGVTLGRVIRHELLVADIGGGSSEIVLAAPGRPTTTEGMRLGSAQLTLDLVRADPPTPVEVDAMREAARRVVAGAPAASPEELVAVGGTTSNLLRVLPMTPEDRVLTRRRVALALSLLMIEGSIDAAARHALRPTRARLLPAGAVIVDAILERYAADGIRVSEEGIREGAVLAAAVAGRTWRDRLSTLAAGWEDQRRTVD